jgi:hypothetical protein
MATMQEIRDQVADLLRADGHYPETDLVASISRAMVACKSIFLANLMGNGQERPQMLVKMSALRAAWNGDKSMTKAPRFQERSRQFQLLHDCMLELYGVKILQPELWDNYAILLNLPMIQRWSYRVGVTKFFTVPNEDSNDVPAIPSIEERLGLHEHSDKLEKEGD